jgi:P27 family predicted phage terminase small subunit
VSATAWGGLNLCAGVPRDRKPSKPLPMSKVRGGVLMTLMGRPAIPAKIKELSGTVRKDRTKETIEYDLLLIAPKPEVWMDDNGKKYFKNICKLLISKKLLNVANVQLVILMAQEFSLYEEATRELKIGGKVFISDKGNYLQSPWVSIRNNAQKNYRDIAALFGLDPVSAMKVGGPARSDKDPFDEMQNKYNQ